MSGATTATPGSGYSSGLLTDAEKADVRRLCGYPTYGAGQAGFQSWRYFQSYGLLEFRMNNLAPAELQNVRYRLAALYPVEAGLDAAYDNLDTDQAAVWHHNKNETRDRKNHFNVIRRTLCEAVGVPPGPNLSGDGTIRLVV